MLLKIGKRPQTDDYVVFFQNKKVEVGGCYYRIKESFAFINGLVMLPQHRGKGIGTGFLRLLEYDAVRKGCNYIVAEMVDNPKFFRNRGYKEMPKEKFEELGYVYNQPFEPFYFKELDRENIVGEVYKIAPELCETTTVYDGTSLQDYTKSLGGFKKAERKFQGEQREAQEAGFVCISLEKKESVRIWKYAKPKDFWLD